MDKCIKDCSRLFLQHKIAFEKCNILWSKSGRSAASENIKSIINCYLKTPCVTRWNSLFDSLTQLIEHKEKLNDVLRVLKSKFSFEQSQNEYLEQYRRIVQPIALAIDNLQGEKTTFYGYLIPTIVTLLVRYKRLEIEFQEDSNIFLLIKTIITSIKKNS